MRRQLADKIREAPREKAPGEAAIAVAGAARSPADAALLVGILGLHGADYRWDLARVAREAVTAGRLGQDVSANAMRHLVPRRAHPLISSAFRELAAAGLAARTGRAVTSWAPGAKGRKVPVYRLTRAGENLAAEIAPPAGSLIGRTLPILI
jgi:hypothetical protein